MTRSPCLRADGQPCPPVAIGWSTRANCIGHAGDEAGPCAGFQLPARPKRSVVARPLQILPGRYRSLPADRDPLYRAQPGAAAMVVRPEDYRWSSVHTHPGQACDPLLTLHPLYLSLLQDLLQRAETYRSCLRSGIDEDELANVGRHTAQERALGDPRFQYVPWVHRPKNPGRSTLTPLFGGD